MTAFVDTSFYIARIMPRDQRHGRHCAPADSLASHRKPIATEKNPRSAAWEALRARGFFSVAIGFLCDAHLSQDVSIIYPDAVLESDGWANARHFRSAGFEVLR